MMANAKHCLIVEIPGESARHYLLSASKITIGRTAKNGIVLEVDTVSGSHLEMKRKGGGYEVVDLGSTNGTRVNGKEVQKEPRELRDGDVIKVGLDVQARFIEMIEVKDFEDHADAAPGSITRKLKKPSQKPRQEINPVAAAVARASKAEAAK